MDIHVRIVELLEKGKNFCLATVLTSDISDVRPGQKAIVYDNGAIVASLGSTQLDSSLADLAQKAFKENKSQVAEIEAGVKFFLNILSPDAQLILCGAGHIAIPLARFAQRLKFRVAVIDDRPDFASPSRFPNCKIIAEDFTVALREYHFSPNPSFRKIEDKLKIIPKFYGTINFFNNIFSKLYGCFVTSQKIMVTSN